MNCTARRSGFRARAEVLRPQYELSKARRSAPPRAPVSDGRRRVVVAALVFWRGAAWRDPPRAMFRSARIRCATPRVDRRMASDRWDWRARLVMRRVWIRPAMAVVLAGVSSVGWAAIALAAHPVPGALYTGNSGKCAAQIREQCVFTF